MLFTCSVSMLSCPVKTPCFICPAHQTGGHLAVPTLDCYEESCCGPSGTWLHQALPLGTVLEGSSWVTGSAQVRFKQPAMWFSKMAGAIYFLLLAKEVNGCCSEIVPARRDHVEADTLYSGAHRTEVTALPAETSHSSTRVRGICKQFLSASPFILFQIQPHQAWPVLFPPPQCPLQVALQQREAPSQSRGFLQPPKPLTQMAQGYAGKEPGASPAEGPRPPHLPAFGKMGLPELTQRVWLQFHERTQALQTAHAVGASVYWVLPRTLHTMGRNVCQQDSMGLRPRSAESVGTDG